MIPKFITDRLWVKLGSVVLAVVVWFYSSSNIREEDDWSVPLDIKLAKGMMIVEESNIQIRIGARGPSDVMKDLQASDFTVACDLSNQTEQGKVTKDISRANIKAPAGIQVFNYYPREVTFTLDKIVEKVLPVKVVTSGMPQEGYRIEAANPNPGLVRVTGAESLLEGTYSVETVPEDVDVTGLNRWMTFRRVRLQPIGGMEPKETVTVRVRVGREPAQKKYADVVVGYYSLAIEELDVAISPLKVEVVLAGLKERLDKLRTADIKVYVDIVGLTPAKYELPLKADLPEGITMREAVPSSCEVVIKSKTDLMPEKEAEGLGNL